MNEKVRTYKRIAIFFSIDRTFNNGKISSQPKYKDRSFRNEKEEKGEKKEGMRCTYHVQPLPNATPFSQDQSDFSDHRILQWYNGLEEAFIVDFAGL